MSFGFDSGSSSSAFSDDSAFKPTGTGDDEMRAALQKLQTQAEFQNQVSQLSSRCWDLCYTGSPGAKFDDKRANCLKNCAERYIDVSVFIRKRFQEYATRITEQQSQL